MHDDGDAFGAVAALLWQERDVLETLLFKLVEEQLIVAAGASEWLPRADAEVRAAVDRLHLQEITRAAEVEALALSRGLSSDVSLAELSEGADEPWAEILAEHRVALRRLVSDIRAVTAENTRLLSATGKAIAETLERLEQGPATYDGRGALTAAHASPRLFDNHA
jgi:hypothetical protein